MSYICGYTDANNDGLPDGVSYPEYGGGNRWNRVDYRAMIYFQNQWWFTQWFCFREEQQW